MGTGAIDGKATTGRTAPVDAAVPTTTRPRSRVAILTALAVGLPLLFLTLPLIALTGEALPALDELTPETRETLGQALRVSLLTTSISLLLIIGLGTPFAFVLARRRLPAARLLNALIDLPIVLPPSVAGIALLMAFGRNGLVGGWLADVGITVGFTTTAVVLAQCFVAAPLYIRAAKVGFGLVEREVEDAAMVDGATPATVFRTITMPLARASLVAGVVLAWARALGEFGATIMVAGSFTGRTQTMPLAIYERFGAGDLTSALTLSIVLLATSLVVLVAIRYLGEPTTPR
ncbi:MAG: molybdate ABC transporter permease subunit [Chloroflexia bacterium]|nr:molybdate ABC transporter permease subunit [Chloroflexia bacterium]